jgi:hypothetical protein
MIDESLLKKLEADADNIVAEVDRAVGEGRFRKATEKEMLKIKVAALESIVSSYQEKIEKAYVRSEA